ncbi:MAG: ABC transporter substrate-binding protein [Cyanobacteria bacterium J06639_1]
MPLGVGLALLGSCTATSSSGDGASDTTASSGQVTILGVIVSEQEEKLRAALAPFEEETGIEVVYEGTDAFATLLPVRVAGGNPPDIAMFPQPGLMADFARDGDLLPLSTFLGEDALQTAYDPYWLELGTFDGESYGLWYRASVKSLVWYRPQAFADAGYEVPTTWDEAIALSDRIVVDGGVPWCMGIESGSATGWPGTDWIEDIMLRTAGAETYDGWVANEVPFNAPEVKAAFEQFGDIARNEDYVVGGSIGVISTPFGDSPQGLFTDPPQCYMHRQANFIASFFPEGVDLEAEIDIFPLPPIDEALGTPILVAGDAFAAFNDTPEVRQLMEYLATARPHEIWAGLGGYISPHAEVSADVYIDDLTRKQAAILAEADTLRFDGSDMMPGAVGTGSFWTGVTDYIGGSSLDTVLDDIQASWPN